MDEHRETTAEELEAKLTVGDAIGLRSIEDMYASALGALSAANARADAAEARIKHLEGENLHACGADEATLIAAKERIAELERRNGNQAHEERKVLDLLAERQQEHLVVWADNAGGWGPVARAELARRASVAPRE